MKRARINVLIHKSRMDLQRVLFIHPSIQKISKVTRLNPLVTTEINNIRI